MIQGINRERLYQDEHNRDNNLIISSSLHHSWFQFFTLVLYFSALCLVLGMTSLTHTSDVLISWRFEKSCLLLANGRFRSQGTGVWSRPFFHSLFMTPDISLCSQYSSYTNNIHQFLSFRLVVYIEIWEITGNRRKYVVNFKFIND